jgi:PPP family 3-phenylpropionic acid transporter
MWARLGACYFLCFAFIGTLAPYLSLYLHEAGSSARDIAMVILSNSWSGAPLLEAMTLSHLKGRTAYGPIRMWGSLGLICAILVAGQLIDHHSSAVVPRIFLLILAGLLPISFASLSNISADQSRPSAFWADLTATLSQSGPVAVLGAGFLMAAAPGAFNVFFLDSRCSSGVCDGEAPLDDGAAPLRAAEAPRCTGDAPLHLRGACCNDCATHLDG